MMRARFLDAVWILLALLIGAYLLIPIALVVLFSFNSSALTSLPLSGLTLDWYGKLFAIDYFWPALQNSLIVAATVCVLSVVAGTLAALALARMPAGRAERLIYLLSLPMMLPGLVIGIALLAYFVRLFAVRLGLATVILGQLVVVQPFVIAILYARLRSFDWSIVDSARDLGASPARAFVTVTLPIIQPVVIGAALMATALSIDDFVLSSFTIGGGNTLPILIWGMLRTNVSPIINAVGTLLILMSVGSTLIALYLTRYRG